MKSQMFAKNPAYSASPTGAAAMWQYNVMPHQMPAPANDISLGVVDDYVNVDDYYASIEITRPDDVQHIAQSRWYSRVGDFFSRVGWGARRLAFNAFNGAVVPATMLLSGLLCAGCVFDETGKARPDGSTTDASTIQTDSEVPTDVLEIPDAIAQTDAEIFDAGPTDAGPDATTPQDAGPDAAQPTDLPPTMTWQYNTHLHKGYGFINFDEPTMIPPTVNGITHYIVNTSDGTVLTDVNCATVPLVTPGSGFVASVRAYYDDGTSSQLSTPRIITIQDSVRGLYTADENGGITLLDYSGYGNDGTFVNTPLWVQGALNTGVLLDGTASSSYIDLGSAHDMPATWPFAIQAVVIPQSTTENQIIVARQDVSTPGQAQGYAAMILANGNAWFDITSISGQQIGIETGAPYTPLIVGETYHFTFTYDGSQNVSGLAIYINGVRADVNAYGTTIDTQVQTTVNTRIGSINGPVTDPYFLGNFIFDEVYIIGGQNVVGGLISGDVSLQDFCSLAWLQGRDPMPVDCDCPPILQTP